MRKKILCLLCILAFLGTIASGCVSIRSSEPFSVLCIGNNYSRDMVYYLHQLAQGRYDIDIAYLHGENANLRYHARYISMDGDPYSLWQTNKDTGMIEKRADHISVQQVLTQQNWDAVILHQNLFFAGYPGTYNADLDYLLDFLRANTQTKIYWNMTWAAADTLSDESVRSRFQTYYSSSNAIMYNAVLTATKQHIVGTNSTFGAAFDGWIPTGIAIENLRETLGEVVTADGHHLSLELGRLAASMTLLKTILPEFDLNTISAKKIQSFLNTSKSDADALLSDTSGYYFKADDLSAIIQAAETACSATQLPEPTPAQSAPISENADITILQTTAPLRPYFPDLVTLEDGTIIIGAYESISHKISNTVADASYAQEGAGRLVLWRSTDNGATWEYDTPLLVVDEKQMEAWGIIQISDRYELLKSGATKYDIMVDPRDPNLGISKTDIDGDGTAEEVLLFTFWTRTFSNTGTRNTGYLMHSIDGGKTWSDPQKITRDDGGSAIKRGCLTAFADGQILIPYYYGNTAASLLMEYNCQEGKWVLLQDCDIPNVAPFESDRFNEVSLAVTKPDSDTVYAFCRENGTVLQSNDRGANWELIGNETGLIHQPGFAVLDETHIFTTWALTTSPRNIYGKVFDIEAGWDATEKQPIYISPNKSAHDMADPSCAVLSDGRILVVAYDTTYRSIVGVYVDPIEDIWQSK